MDFPNKVSLAATFTGFWNPSPGIQIVCLTIFFIFPILFNFWYVRYLGEIEYWITAIKIITILVLIVTGILIVIGLSTEPLLGTSSQYQPVSCSDNEIGNCVPGPGLISLDPHYLKH
jgi:amino acid permease